MTSITKLRAKLSKSSYELLHWLEIILAFFVVSIVIIGVIELIISLPPIKRVDTTVFHKLFETIFGDVILLVFGLELAILMVKRRLESIVEIMFFVVARKMLVHSSHVYELLLGVAAIGGLFAIRKYLMVCTICSLFEEPKPSEEG